jgi:hypothetical protein
MKNARIGAAAPLALILIGLFTPGCGPSSDAKPISATDPSTQVNPAMSEHQKEVTLRHHQRQTDSTQ